MASNQVYMSLPDVRGFASKFGQISQVLSTIAKVMEALSNTLKATAFIGNVGGAALAMYLDTIKPQIQNLAQQTQQIGQDLSKSADAYERGDQQGATRFY